jgi:hypothetical protein
MTLILTAEQHASLAAATDLSAVPVLDPAGNAAYVLVPQEVYRRLAPYDDSEFDISEAYPLMDEVAMTAGWDDPELDVYNQYDPRKKP